VLCPHGAHLAQLHCTLIQLFAAACVLRGARLGREQVQAAVAGGGDLRGADLRGADLSELDLSNVDLRDGNLEGNRIALFYQQ
jgi:uncharacterized protein YjbI with pentapeptide repeats